MTAAGTDTSDMTAVERAAVSAYERAVMAAPCGEVEDNPLRLLAAMQPWLAGWWGLVDKLDAVVHAPDRAPTDAARDYVDGAITDWLGARQLWLQHCTEAFLLVGTEQGSRTVGVPRPDPGGALSTSTRPDAGSVGYVPPAPS